MIDGWWRNEFGREPTIDDLDEKARIAVRQRVDAAALRIDRVANVVLAVWLVASTVLLVALAADALPNDRPTIAMVWWLLVPAYAAGLRGNLRRKATRREVMRQVRRDRLAEITNALRKR